MIKIFKIIGLLEGISAIVLFFVAMPMKYWFDNPSLIRPVGMAHGVLFTIFIVLAIILTIKLQWNFKKLLVISIGAIVPLGTFYVDQKYLKNV